LKEFLFDLHSQIEEKHWWFTARRQIIHKILNRIAPPKEGLSIVNVGCGTGSDLSYFSQFYRCIGIDSSNSAVAKAGRRAPEAIVILGSSADAVLHRKRGEQRIWFFMDVLEHINKDQNFFNKYTTVMESGEIIIITVPANSNLWSLHDNVFGHYRRYTEKKLKRLWYHLPFKVLLLSHFNTRLYPFIWLIRNIENKIVKMNSNEETNFKLLPSLLNRLLHKIFYGEHKRILGIMDGGSPYHFGASLIAILVRI
jgi:SAM-dependent methyltransferase